MTLSGTPSCASGESAQHGASGGGLPRSPAGGAVDHAEQRSAGHGAAHVESGPELLEAAVVHFDLAAAAAFAAPDQDRATAAVEIELVEVERFLNAQAGTPEHNDQPAGPRAVDRSPQHRITAMISSVRGGSAG